MGRWEPGAAARLRAAALDLYLEHGVEETTVADIAARAGVTPRTFFRYFADKREVLFGGQDGLRGAMLEGLAKAPADAAPLEAVAAALVAGCAWIGASRAYSRRRQAVIDASPELQERERAKLAHAAELLAGALRDRGVPEPDATLAAETAMVAFRVGFARWIAEGGDDEPRHGEGSTADEVSVHGPAGLTETVIGALARLRAISAPA